MANYANRPSDFSADTGFDPGSLKISLIVSEWNSEVTEALYTGARDTLLRKGIIAENIRRTDVPGSYEIPLAARWQAENSETDAVIALGCVIQGETPHFTFICDAVAHGLMQVGLTSGKPVIFGVLTTDTHQQALDRSGGRHGNKGEEAALTALRMLGIRP